MATPYAFVTLVSSDSYLPGALALVAALKEVHSNPPVSPEVNFQTACLVTPETVDVSTIKLLRKSFDLVVGVEVIEQQDLKGLQLLGKFPFNPNIFPVLCQRKTIPTIEIHPSQWVSWRAYPYVWRVIAISLTRLHLDLFQPARGIIALFPLVWPY